MFTEIHIHILNNDKTLLEDLIITSDHYDPVTLARQVADKLEYSFETRETLEEETLF